MWDRQTSRFPVDLLTMSVEKSEQCSTARFEKQNKQRQQQKQQKSKTTTTLNKQTKIRMLFCVLIKRSF